MVSHIEGLNCKMIIAYFYLYQFKKKASTEAIAKFDLFSSISEKDTNLHRAQCITYNTACTVVH